MAESGFVELGAQNTRGDGQDVRVSRSTGKYESDPLAGDDVQDVLVPWRPWTVENGLT